MISQLNRFKHLYSLPGLREYLLFHRTDPLPWEY